MKKKMINEKSTCPFCKSEARRVLREGRFYIQCTACGADTIAKTIKTLKEEIAEIYE